MYTPVIIQKGRTNTIVVDIGEDVSADTFSSEIRIEANQDSTLIATWTVTFATDGTDGRLVLTLDDSVTDVIANINGFMDIKRVTSGEPLNVFIEPLPVVFVGTVTA